MRDTESLPVCITDDGAVLPASRFTIPAHQAARLHVDAAPRVRAWLDFRGTACRIRLQTPGLSEKAEAALYRLLERSRLQRVVVSFVTGDGTRHTIYRSGIEAIAGIETAIAELRSSVQFSRRTAERSSLDQYPTLRQLLRLYQFNGNKIDPNFLTPMLLAIAQSRYLIAARDNDNAVRIEAIGLGYAGFDAKWSSQAIGSPIEEQPDRAYGTWLGSGYRDAMLKNRPEIDVVEASVYHPTEGQRRFRYHRLLLPFQPRTGRSVLLSVSVLAPNAARLATSVL